MRKVQRTMRGIIHIIPGVASGCEILLNTRPFPYSLAIKNGRLVVMLAGALPSSCTSVSIVAMVL